MNDRVICLTTVVGEHEPEKAAFIEAFKIGHRVAEGASRNTDFELDEILTEEALAHYWGWKEHGPKGLVKKGWHLINTISKETSEA